MSVKLEENVDLEDDDDDDDHDYPEQLLDVMIEVDDGDVVVPVDGEAPKKRGRLHVPVAPLTPREENAHIAQEVVRLRTRNEALRRAVDECGRMSRKMLAESAQIDAFSAKTAAVNAKMRLHNVEMRTFGETQLATRQQAATSAECGALTRCIAARRILRMFKLCEKDGYTRIVKDVFTETQMRHLQGKRDARWPKQDVYMFNLLHEFSAPAYVYLRDVYKYPLPAPSELADMC